MSVSEYTYVNDENQNKINKKLIDASSKIENIQSDIKSFDSEDKVLGAIQRLEAIKEVISCASLLQSDYINLIQEMFDHDREGQKTYRYDKYDVVIKTPFSYRLNLKKYTQNKDKIPEEFKDFVWLTTETKFSVNKERIEQILEDCSEPELELINSMVKKSPSPKKIELKPRTNF